MTQIDTPGDHRAPLARQDLLQPLMAGTLAAVVGYASTFTLVLAGLAAAGADAAQAGSGLFAVCLVMAALNLVVSWRLRMPVSIAWSTPAAAFLLTTGAPTGGFAETVGAFLMAAGLIVLSGLFRPLARAVERIPAPIASAMLAGVLLPLCLSPVEAVQAMPALALPIVGAWLLGLRFARRFAVPLSVFATAAILVFFVPMPSLPSAGLPQLVPVMPVFGLESFVRLSLPLFVVTMASQNLPGLAVLAANRYRVDAAPLFVTTGLASALTAIFGGVAVNLAAITAAICAGPEAHPDPAKRWVAPMATGATYVVLALLAGVAAAFIAASPPLLIQTVAGLALFSSLSGALSAALAEEPARIPAVVTFVTTASGVSIAGVGGAFWGLVAGIALFVLLRPARPRAAAAGR